MVLPLILLGLFWLSLGGFGIIQLNNVRGSGSKIDYLSCIVLIVIGIFIFLIGFFNWLNSSSAALIIINFVLSLISYKAVIGPYKSSRRRGR